MGSMQEFLILIAVIAVLSSTGWWPRIIRGIRELRGDSFPDSDPNATDLDLCYKMLGVAPSAKWEDIEKAYRKKAKLHHPDLGGDDDTMRALNDAYNCLKSMRRNS